MLLIPKLNKEDMSELNNKFIIIGSGNRKKQKIIYDILKYRGLKVDAVYLTNYEIHEKIIIKNWKVKIITEANIEIEIHEIKTHEIKNIIYIPVTYTAEGMKEAQKMSELYNIDVFSFSSGQIISSFYQELYFDLIKNKSFLIKEMLIWKLEYYKRTSLRWLKFKRENKKNFSAITICSPKKTADVSLNKTFDYLNSNNQNSRMKINYINLLHKIQYINKDKSEKNFGKFKVIIGIREPIAQNISSLYQEISDGIDISNWICGEMKCLVKHDRKHNINKYNEIFIEKGEDIQILWDAFVKRYIYSDINTKTKAIKSIQEFLPETKRNLLDITAYPFDKEKGYTIIQEGNTEVFIYQLEKLNNVISVLSEWVGVPFEKLEKGNVGTDKWIGESYKQALQEIEISQEYFDRCYNESYVQHCYSQEDIEKFKARWRPHIKKED